MYNWKNNTKGVWLNCSETFFHDPRKGLALRNTPEAGEIQRRLRANICFDFSVILSVIVPGDKIAVSGFSISAKYRRYKDDDEDWETFDGNYAKKKGVSLLHVLEQIQGLSRTEAPPIGEPNYVYEERSFVYLG